MRWFSPFPLLDHLGVGLLDEISDPSERLAPPVAQLFDFCLDQLCRRLFVHDRGPFSRIVVARPSLEYARLGRVANRARRLCNQAAVADHGHTAPTETSASR